MTTNLDRAIILAGEYRRLVAAGRLAEADKAESTIDELVGHYQYANQLCFLWPSAVAGAAGVSQIRVKSPR